MCGSDGERKTLLSFLWSLLRGLSQRRIDDELARKVRDQTVRWFSYSVLLMPRHRNHVVTPSAEDSRKYILVTSYYTPTKRSSNNSATLTDSALCAFEPTQLCACRSWCSILQVSCSIRSCGVNTGLTMAANIDGKGAAATTRHE